MLCVYDVIDGDKYWKRVIGVLHQIACGTHARAHMRKE